MAAGLSLRPETVEKDYILGWMLYGINKHDEINHWAFKGGTSFKKCFFETFRFSEDLDFTLTDPSHLTIEFLLQTFNDITDRISDETGIEFFKDRFKFKILPKENGNYSAQGKIHYNGPLRRTHSVASIKLDLTNDEVLVLDTIEREVDHPYTDKPASGIAANCYAFEEVVAEKIRALAQRIRPRDLYDVVHFYRNREVIKAPKKVCDVLKEKCAFKNMDVPDYSAIINHEKFDELEPQWANMLAHQLPHLPPIESFLKDLPPFFEWLNDQLHEEQVEPYGRAGEFLYQPERFTNYYGVDEIIEKIRFAAANRLCINLEYKDKIRTVEPLSFRTSSKGNQLFYGHEREAGHPKAYTLSEIQSVELTDQSYIEQYPVEISSTGSISMPPIRRTSYSTRNSVYSEPKHRYECTMCGKVFKHKTMNSVLRRHKDKDGWGCSGRSGHYLGYE
ncbi:MAG: nucleotidyl transferase AbiEii/AbiGii toxin family protein [Flavobacteriales bacterium]|nr:nucleotidyl transferase AbiEii/AbiGii toxin family protein [Flavobacteriales bacterium]